MRKLCIFFQSRYCALHALRYPRYKAHLQAKASITTNIEKNGWDLRSAVDRHRAFPDTFHIPSEQARTSLQRGDAAKILVDIETKMNGDVVDRGIHRMWVIIIAVLDEGYIGVLDSDPGSAENLNLSHRDVITFNAEHICGIDQPPKDFLVQEYAQYFQ